MATKYVATTGNDSTGTGAIGSPWATLGKALNTAATGDTIQMRAGTYSQTFKNGRDTVIIENYPNENVVIQRTTVGSVLGLENCRNITIRRNASGGTFTVRSTLTGNGGSSGIYVYMAGGGTPGFVPSNILIDGVIVRDIAGYGIHVADASAVTTQNVDISHTATGIRYRRVTGASYIQDGASHHTDRMILSTVGGNEDNGGTGISVDTSNGVTVQRMRLYENHAPSFDYGMDGGALALWECSNTIVQDCICYNNEGFIETGTGNATTYPQLGNIVRRNLVYGRQSYIDPAPGETSCVYHRAGDLRLENNTFDVDDGQNVIVVHGNGGSYKAPIHNTKIKNNIIISRHASTRCLAVYNVASTGATGVVIDYNLLLNTTGSGARLAETESAGYTGTQLANWQSATPYSDHDIWNDDPDFVDRSVRDYALQGSSPAINAGAVIPGTTTGYVGAAPDLGRYEYASVPVPDVDANVILATASGSAKNAVVHTTNPASVQAAAGAALGTGAALLGDTGPDAPVITYPASNGTSTNGIVVVSGTAESGVLVELLDGVTSVGTTNAVGGAWSISLPAVSVGPHTYTAKATNVAGVTSGASNSRVITVETTAPEVSTSVPADGATGIAVGTNVVVTFSEAMDPATITTSSFRVLRNGTPVAGTITMSAGDTVATFNPTSDLAAGTTYVVELSTVIKDVAGNSLS